MSKSDHISRSMPSPSQTPIEFGANPLRHLQRKEPSVFRQTVFSRSEQIVELALHSLMSTHRPPVSWYPDEEKATAEHAVTPRSRNSTNRGRRSTEIHRRCCCRRHGYRSGRRSSRTRQHRSSSCWPGWSPACTRTQSCPECWCIFVCSRRSL